MDGNSLTNQLDIDVIITTTEMHTGGEPVRIIESGYPVPQGKTILDKINNLKEKYDDFRKFLMYEPRGHVDMYGVLLVVPDNPEADIAAIFMHNEGYSTMCGHACISLGRYAVDRGLIRRPITSPETQVNIQVPCGMVKAFVQVDPSNSRKTGRVRFESTPCFTVATDVEIKVDNIGTMKVDVGYGGAFYAFVSARDAGLEFGKTSVAEFTRTGTAIKNACIPVVPLSHPEVPAFFYGVMFVDSRDKLSDGNSMNLCIFADAETDRSPCGSGTSARVAVMYHRGLLEKGQERVFRNAATHSEFIGKPLTDTMVADKKAVFTEIGGHGYYCGNSTFHLEKGDVHGRGFLIR